MRKDIQCMDTQSFLLLSRDWRLTLLYLFSTTEAERALQITTTEVRGTVHSSLSLLWQVHLKCFCWYILTQFSSIIKIWETVFSGFMSILDMNSK